MHTRKWINPLPVMILGCHLPRRFPLRPLRTWWGHYWRLHVRLFLPGLDRLEVVWWTSPRCCCSLQSYRRRRKREGSWWQLPTWPACGHEHSGGCKLKERIPSFLEIKSTLLWTERVWINSSHFGYLIHSNLYWISLDFEEMLATVTIEQSYMK